MGPLSFLLFFCFVYVSDARKLFMTEDVRHRPHFIDSQSSNREVTTPSNTLKELLLTLQPSGAHSAQQTLNARRNRGSPPVARARSNALNDLKSTDKLPRQATQASKESNTADGIMRQAPLLALGAAMAAFPVAALAGDIGSAVDHTSSLLAFADQAGNLAGSLFANSLFPYLIFLYFLRQDVNGLSPVAKAGFTYLLVFVAGTIGCSIASTKMFGLTLANSDWLHSYAEQFLAFTNVIDVVGLKLTLDGFLSGRVTQPATKEQVESKVGEKTVVGIATAVAAAACLVTFVANGGDFAGHTPYLGGFGNLPEGFLPVSEPENALSLPTWVIHASSLLEWLVAQGLVWRIALASGNEKWKGMTWAMIPSHSSGIVACVYHIFYNQIQDLVLLQSALTFLGNSALAFASYRIAASNGWEFSLPSFGDAKTDETGVVSAEDVETVGDSAEGASDTAPTSPKSTNVGKDAENVVASLATIFAWSVIASYVVKYGGAAVPITMEAPEWAALIAVAMPTAYNVYKWNERSQAGGDFRGLI